MTLPNFIIGGALKAGTTSLFQYIEQHPQAFMPDRKELRYFAYDPTDPWCQENGHAFPLQTLADYTAEFDKATDQIAIGEASPNYLASDAAPGNIKAVLPDVKLIFSLRDPVRSAYSAYLMALRAGRDTRPVADALAVEERQVTRYLYAHYMERWYSLFDRSQIKVVLFEDLIADPVAVAQSVYGFLGIDASFVPDLSGVKANSGGVPRNKTGAAVYRALNWLRGGEMSQKIRPYLPQAARDAFGGMRQASLQKAPPLPDEIATRLRSFYQPDIAELEKLIQRDLSIWS